MALTERDRTDITDLLNLHGHLVDAGDLDRADNLLTPDVTCDLEKREAGPREVLDRCRRAAIDRSAEGMRRVYALDAVHEFPFTYPGVPSRLEGRDEIVNWIVAGWRANPLRYERYRTLAVHDTNDPQTIVVEQDVLGTSPATGPFTLPSIVVLTARDGEIARLRDYVNIPAAAAALGHDLPARAESPSPTRP
jgi:ketosteroid isomerase-like protein